MKKIIGYLTTGIVAALILSFGVHSADWSNPNPRQLSDLAGPLLLKHETNMSLLFANTTGYLNQLKDNFAGSVAPTTPSTGQAWYDTSVTPALFRLYNGAAWTGAFGGDIVSTGTSTFSGSIISSGTNSFGGVNTFNGGIVSNATFTHIGGLPVTTVTGTTGYPITAADMGSTIIANLSSAATFTLPAASAVPVGSGLVTKVTGSTVTLVGTVEGVANPTLGQNDEIKIWSNGTVWYGKPFSQTPAANAIPVSLGTGLINSAWVTSRMAVYSSGTATFTAPVTGTYTVLLAGGGGGGGAGGGEPGTSLTQAAGGGGGGAPGKVYFFTTTQTVGDLVSITVGTGGTGGTGSSNHGENGGNSVYGSFTAAGGAYGGGGAGGAAGAGGGGGAAIVIAGGTSGTNAGGSFTVLSGGGAGGTGNSNNSGGGGAGGSSPLFEQSGGTGGNGVSPSYGYSYSGYPGGNATLYAGGGGGGGGAAVSNAPGATVGGNGGNGSPGIVVIWW